MTHRAPRPLPLAAVLLALLLVLAPSAGRAEVLYSELRINGLVCPFCAFGIEKKLRNIEGVERVTVLLDEGVVQLEFAERNGVTFGDLRDAVSAAGFKLAGLKVEVRGRIEAGDDGKILVAAPDLRLRLVNDATDDPPSEHVTRFGSVDRIASELPDLLVEERPSHPGVNP